MRKLLHRLRAGRQKWYFQQAELREVTENFSNPARGWYQIHTFQVEQEPDFAQLEWCLDRTDTLTLVIIDIGAFKERNLSQECLKRISSILQFFADNQYDLIVRVVYDHEGNAIEREPFFFQQVLSHLRQLGGILDQFADSIFVYQGMLVGNWGEMHTSRFLAEDKLTQMADVLRYYKCEQTYLAVRRPVYWRMLHPDQAGGALRCPDGMGLFDDGIFGSETHLGTFGMKARESVGWGEPWSRTDELAFERQISALTPNGGEVVYDDAFAKSLTPEAVLEELRQMQITYLNKVYDGKMLDVWRKWKCPVQGAWTDKSLYDYVGAHLGYRFMIRSVSVTPKHEAAGRCMVELEMENTGFASFYQEADIWLEYKDADGIYRQISFGSNLKGWNSGEKRMLTCEMEIGNCDLFLRAARKQDKTPILFAHSSDKEGRTFLGRLSLKG